MSPTNIREMKEVQETLEEETAGMNEEILVGIVEETTEEMIEETNDEMTVDLIDEMTEEILSLVTMTEILETTDKGGISMTIDDLVEMMTESEPETSTTESLVSLEEEESQERDPTMKAEEIEKVVRIEESGWIDENDISLQIEALLKTVVQ